MTRPLGSKNVSAQSQENIRIGNLFRSYLTRTGRTVLEVFEEMKYRKLSFRSEVYRYASGELNPGQVGRPIIEDFLRRMKVI